MTNHLRLGVNIDHVATVRHARGVDYPDPVRAALLAAALWASCLAAPASASDAAHGPAPSGPKAPGSSKPLDPMALIEGSADAWSVSRTEAGCYLMSPYRVEASRLAIGRHPTLGLGLFAVSLRLSVPLGGDEPVAIQAVDGQELRKAGRMTGANVLFVPLDQAEAGASLRALQESGTLWLSVRRTWIAHAGHLVQDAVAHYARACAASG